MASIIDALGNFIKAIFELFAGIIQTILNLFKGVFEAIYSFFTGILRLFGDAGETVFSIFGNLVNFIAGKLSLIATLAGHEASVSCIALGEDKIVSGGDDKTIKVWSFAG